nr:penicillin-binding protein 2 [Methanomicrobia archaeon]
VSPSDIIYCEQGQFKIFRQIIHDTHPHGSLTVSDTLAKSSNIGIVKIALKLEKPALTRYVRAFGFSKKTQIDLPYEAKGTIDALDKWSKSALIYVPFGQGILVTPVQMLCAMNAIANDGKLMKPYIVKEILDSKGNMVQKTKAKIEQHVITPETARMVTQMLKNAVSYGTGKKAQVTGYCVAGKTGTAQKAGAGGYSSDKYVSTFAGFLPADNPQLSIIVVICEPKEEHRGGHVAAPAFQAIAEQAIRRFELRVTNYELRISF